MAMTMYFNELKIKFKEKSSQLPGHVQHRIYRTLSWLNQADNIANTDKKFPDLDSEFISLWIAFNAIYARKDWIDDKERFKAFIKVINDKESEKLNKILWELYSSKINVFLKNRYVFRQFWDFHNSDGIDAKHWNLAFEDANLRAQQCLKFKNSEELLLILFERIYTLRNQIFHGGSTYNSSVNRPQLITACGLLKELVPVFALVVLNNPNDDNWGHPFYPVIED
ncbi:hypothetical protein [Wohlfahrtiimonas larvae]|uniref:HEPN domain-containing protein n=2 Tax=Wohlfahrtiimonas larvae TaxID=1157986 RepID=A0ABP9MVG0_9GAMM